jgi:hypothetical protein
MPVLARAGALAGTRPSRGFAAAGAKYRRAMEPGRSGKGGSATSLRPPAPAARRRLLRAAVLVVGVAAALVSWLASRESGSGTGGTEPVPASGPRVVSVAQLREIAATAEQPVYWAGRVAGRAMAVRELSQEAGIQVLYLPASGGADAAARSLTVGSYPLPDPAGAVATVAGRPGSIVRRGAGGRRVVTARRSPTSVYFASPDNSVQVEVYDPSPALAMRLALSGRILPVR